MDTKKVYRLALYGLSGTGKTCILAALAMPRYPHPLGHSCVWRAMDVPPPQDELEQKDKSLTILHRSKEWIETAVHQLSQRVVPASNPTDEECFIFEYDFTASTHQTFRVELIDYSGEFINPMTSINNSVVAKNMRKKFADVDGILVLAEAPFRPDVDQDQNPCNETYKDLYPLRQAFNSFRCEMQNCSALDIPVAFLITKWDRYSDIDYVNPVSEQNKLDDFFNLNPPPPHKGIRDVLHFSVTEDNFKAFPISALGATDCVSLDDNSVAERPKQIAPLNAFGLEDAFIWLVQRSDNIAFQKFKEQATQELLNQCHKIGIDLLDRFPKNSEPTKQIKKILEECRQAKRSRRIYRIIMIIALWFVVETTIDMAYYRKNLVAVNNPHATSEQLDHAEVWFTQYIAAPYFRHFASKIFLSRKKARAILIQLQTLREQFLWDPVKKSYDINNLHAAKERAIEYLNHYPYGQHAQEAQDIKLRAEIQQKQRDNEDAFRRIISRIPPANQQNIEEVYQVLKDLRNLPHPQVETKELRNKRIELEKQLSKQLRQLNKQREWLNFRNKFKQKVRQKEFKIALELLKSRDEPDANLAELKNHLKKAVIQALKQRVKRAQENNEYLNIKEKYANYPSDLRSQEGEQKVADWQRELDEMQRQRDEAVDRTLYDVVRKYPDNKEVRDNIKKYLDEAPLKTMKEEVKKYLSYLDKTHPDNMLKQLRLNVMSIHWTYVEDEDNIVIVELKVGGKGMIYEQKEVDAIPYKSTTINGISPFFEAKSSSHIKIKITVEHQGFFFGKHDYGYGIVEKSVSEIANGYDLILRTRKGKGKQTGKAFIKIEGYPQKPNLPFWHPEQK